MDFEVRGSIVMIATGATLLFSQRQFKIYFSLKVRG